MFIDLGVQDSTCSDCNIILAYVLKKQENVFDTEPLVRALRKVTDKWRLLAGRLVWDKKRKMCRIWVPMGGLTKPTFKFTTTTYHESINSPSFLKPNVATRPHWKYFYHPFTPFAHLHYVLMDHPILSVHVSHLDDATCIGISWPHGVFDATGAGLIMQAISAEIASQEWVPPPVMSKNLDDAFIELERLRVVTEKSVPASANYESLWVPGSLASLLKLLVLVAYEYIFFRVVTKNVFLNEGTVDRMVSEVKLQAKSHKEGRWVSTGDVISTWFLKTAMAGEKGPPAIRVAIPISFRPLLTPINSTYGTSPHNWAPFCPMPKFSSSWLNSATFAEVALVHRNLIEQVRTIPFARSLARYFAARKNDICRPVPLHHYNEPLFILSNQVISRLTDVSFGPGTELEAFWEWAIPFVPTSVALINKYKGGYVITAMMRESRWNSVEKEIKRINNGGSFT